MFFFKKNRNPTFLCASLLISLIMPDMLAFMKIDYIFPMGSKESTTHPFPHVLIKNETYTISYVYNVSDCFSIQTGKIRPTGPGDSDVILLKSDENEEIVWMMRYGGDGYDEAHYVTQTSDGGYIVVGSTTGFGAFLKDVYVLKTDPNGALEWYGVYGGLHSEWGLFAKESCDGGYIIEGKMLILTDPRIIDPGVIRKYVLTIDETGILERETIER